MYILLIMCIMLVFLSIFEMTRTTNDSVFATHNKLHHFYLSTFVGESISIIAALFKHEIIEKTLLQ